MLELASVPQGMGRILDKGIALYKTCFLQVMGIGLVMCVAGLGFYFFYDLVLFPALLRLIELLSSAESLYLNIFLNMLVVLSYWSLFFLYFSRVYLLKYANLCYQQDARVLSVFKQALAGLFATFFVFVLWGILLLGLVLLPIGLAIASASITTNPGVAMAVTVIFTIPLLIYLISSLFWLYVITIDKGRIADAISRSHKLVWGNWWRTTLFFGIINIFLTILWLLFILPFPEFWQISFQSPDDYLLTRYALISNPVYNIAMIIYMMISIPFMVAMMLPYYHDLKLRKEGRDLAARINTV